MAGGRGAAEIGAGANGRTNVQQDAGKPRQPRPVPRQAAGAVETDEAVVLKLQAQTIHKQLQVECSTLLFPVSQDRMLIAGNADASVQQVSALTASRSQHLLRTCTKQ